MILIYTNKEDIHPTNVIQYLNEWGIPVFRLNTECLLSDYETIWRCDSKSSVAIVRNIKNGLELNIENVTAVWDRRPEKPVELKYPSNDGEIKRYILSEGIEFLQYLRSMTYQIWSLGSISNDRIASSKLLQQKLAIELGMQIPATVISNCSSELKSFAARHRKIALKSLSGESVAIDANKQLIMYTTLADGDEISSLPEEAFSQTVCCMQEYVEKDYELRITVVDKEIVACRIDSQQQNETKGKIDWRQGLEDGLRYQIVDIPDEIKSFCHAFLKKLNLNFGCFDFIVTPRGDYVFLECNPNGQWLWIELETGFDISKTIARALSQFEKKHQLSNNK